MLFRLILFISLFTLSLTGNAQKNIKITWVDSVDGDFSFTEQWEYPLGVYQNEFGQVIFMGFEELQDGRVNEDTLASVYSRMDTSHEHYTMSSESDFSEFDKADYLKVLKMGNGNLDCQTDMNASTHCTLLFTLADDICKARVILYGIVKDEVVDYNCTGGYFMIDKPAYDKGILKAKYDFTFKDGKGSRYWKALIYAPIKE